MNTKNLNADPPAGSQRKGQEVSFAGESPSSALEILGGTEVGGYRLLEKIGAGGYGEVWKAHGPGELPKAVKLLYGERSGSHAEAELKSLDRMKELRHPFLLCIERIECINSRVIVVSELADGNLSDRFEEHVRDGRPGIPRDELLEYLRDSADALDYMSQEHGLQHLDIKPDNILIQGAHAKVADFGLAKDLNATRISMMNGFTPTFAAPELFEGTPGHWSDQYSLAIVYQLMLTGFLPFNGRNAAQLTAQHLRSKPDLSRLDPGDRPAIARALSKNPRSRFDSCRELVDELCRRSERNDVGTSVSLPPSTVESASFEPTSHLGSIPVIESERDTADGQSSTDSATRLYVGLGGLGNAIVRHVVQADSEAGVRGILIDSDSSSLRLPDFEDSPAPLVVQHIPLRSSLEYRALPEGAVSWLSRRWLFNIPRSGLVEGIRPLGCLAFMDHYDEIRRVFFDQLQDVGGRVEIVLVAGLCGGTGSGAAAEAIQLIQQVLDESEHSHSAPAAVLIHTRQQDSPVEQACGLALLKELDCIARSRRSRNQSTCSVQLVQSSGDAENLQAISHWLRDHDREPSCEGGILTGLSVWDPHSCPDFQAKADALADDVLKTWIFQTSSAQAIRSGSMSVIRSLLANLHLTPDSLIPHVKVFLNGQVGRDIRNVAGRVAEELSSIRPQWTSSELLSELRARLEDGESATELTRQITGSFENSLNQISSNCRTVLREQVVRQLDGPFRFCGSQAASEICINTLTETLKVCEKICQETEIALAEFSVEGERESREEDVLTFCRKYCCLAIYPIIYQIFSRHIHSIREDVTVVSGGLKTLREQLIEAADSSRNPDMDEQTQLFDDYIRETESHVLSALSGSSEEQQAIGSRLRLLAMRFLLSTEWGGSEQQSEFVKDAWPWLRGCGGRHRVSVTVPDYFDIANLKLVMEAEFGECVSFKTDATSESLLACCSIHDVSLDGISSGLSMQHPAVPDLANRLHTRIDVDWSDPASYSILYAC